MNLPNHLQSYLGLISYPQELTITLHGEDAHLIQINESFIKIFYVSIYTSVIANKNHLISTISCIDLIINQTTNTFQLVNHYINISSIINNKNHKNWIPFIHSAHNQTNELYVIVYLNPLLISRYQDLEAFYLNQQDYSSKFLFLPVTVSSSSLLPFIFHCYDIDSMNTYL